MPSMPRAKSACANVGKATLAQQTISSGSYEFGPSRIVTSQRGSQMTPCALCSSHQPWIDLTRPASERFCVNGRRVCVLGRPKLSAHPLL